MPGVARVDADLEARLTSAVRARGAGAVARTRHRTASGEPRYTNRLALQTSPYLLQHAHNPVNWFPWGEEAFERARIERRPILLSVGYSTCHWCHVMERESFEDEEIAGYINQHFIPVKVDREERPDVDALYMAAVHVLAGRGGWPMTVALTPERDPFFAGTYFPPRAGARGARKGLLGILQELAAQHAADPAGVVERARSVSRRVQAALAPARPAAIPGPEALTALAGSLVRSLDPTWGGFGGAPKFPQPAQLELLLRVYRRTGDERARDAALLTLERMAAGGIHDQVGGGFHRYSVDARWRVPHFEKMLYDNAQLAIVYLEAYQVTGRTDLADVARRTLDYVAREMTSPEGAFYSATDADSPAPGGHEEEGRFFTWTPAELEEALGSAAGRRFGVIHGVTAAGDLDGRSVLHRPRPLAEVARELASPVPELERQLVEARRVLLARRASRPPPARDEKILAAWTGLMISAFARGALALGDPALAGRAAAAARFVVTRMRSAEGRLLRVHVAGRAHGAAQLDDHAFLIQGLIDLFEATAELRWLDEALGLQRQLDEHHRDASGGGYFATGHDHEALLARVKPDYDGAEPSGNSVEVLNLLRLEELTGDAELRQGAERALAAFATPLTRGSGAAKLASALDFYLDEPLEIFLVTPEGGGGGPLLDVVKQSYLPNRILLAVPGGAALATLAARVPALEGKRALGGVATAYVCRRGSCDLPATDPALFARQLAPAWRRRAPRAP
ncbi:MAG: thioredoxin domain-containing protein [Polyangiaceae bacterium]|nr:thioredoxin domain-containing protein [Polyangiaceae bacterium]